MRKAFLLILLIPTLLSAQNQQKQLFNIESFSMLESNNLNNDFFLNFYTGQFLDSALKHNALSQLNDMNSLGYYTINSARFAYINNEKKFGPYFNISYQKMLGMEFSSRFFELVFIGNESFSGQNIDLTPLQLRYLEFGSIQSGVLFSPSENISVYAYAGPAFGMIFQELETQNLEMYTSDITDSISLNYQLNYSRSPSYPAINGFGFSAGIGTEGKSYGFNWSVQIDNLGMLWYNERSVFTAKDSLIEFNGFELDELNDISSSIENELDRFENAFVLDGDTGNIQNMLPLKAELILSKEFPYFNLTLKSIYLNIPGFTPYVELRPSKRIFKTVSLSFPLKYGGFGKFNAGIGVEGSLNKNLNFRIYSPTILSAAGLTNELSYGLHASIFLKLTENESSF